MVSNVFDIYTYSLGLRGFLFKYPAGLLKVQSSCAIPLTDVNADRCCHGDIGFERLYFNTLTKRIMPTRCE